LQINLQAEKTVGAQDGNSFYALLITHTFKNFSLILTAADLIQFGSSPSIDFFQLVSALLLTFCVISEVE
jgi:hypothetical protein